MMYSHSLGLFTDFPKHSLARFTLSLHLNLDQFMRFQTVVDFLEHAVRKPIVADHDNRMEVVAEAAEMADLLGIELGHGEDIDKAERQAV